MSLDLYREQILDHNRNPRNFGALPDADTTSHVANPLCGDELDFFLKFEEGKVVSVQFTGRGCSVSMASASMLTEKLKGMSKAEIEKLTTDDILTMLGVEVNAARMKCATLSLEAAQQAIGHH